jgi:di/tricarboxylate transporter
MPLGLATGTLVVFVVVAVTVALFVTETLPPDVVAVGVAVSLVALEPWTGVSTAEALAGFASPATITILAMYVLSAGVQSSGLVSVLGRRLAPLTGDSEGRLVGTVVGLTGPVAGVVNNTPVVAVFIPMVSELAADAGVSPSKVLIPLSYASMLGGTLTLVGTATNLVASQAYVDAATARGFAVSPFSMFEFTALGAVVVLVGVAYLVTVGRALLPERVPPGDRTTGYEVRAYLARVLVPSRSPLVGEVAADVVGDARRDLGVDVLDVVRGEEHFVAADSDRTLEGRDVLTVRADADTIRRFASVAGLRVLPRAEVDDEALEGSVRGTLVELVVPTTSSVVGETVAEAHLRERYDATVLAIRRGGDLLRESLGEVRLEAGDSLLVQTTAETAAYLPEVDDFVVTSEAPSDRVGDGFDPSKAVSAVAILLSVVTLAAVGFPVAIAALAGVVATVALGVLSTTEAYDAVSWDVVFLLAGMVPLGRAVQETGGAALVAEGVLAAAAVLPIVGVLAVFYVLTGLLANVVTPVASVVLLMPVAVDTAARVGADPFAFALAVTFAASTAFMTPVGYQTNLMVYGPGGYRFSDYLRVGAPLQALLTVVTTAGIVWLYGLG